MSSETAVDPRRCAILDGLDLERARGAEVGPLDKPLVPWRRGSVFYVDRAPTEALKRHWSADPNVDVSRLHVDAVWGRNTLREAIAESAGQDVLLDYIVASHVIEHVPDLIEWLRETQSCLRPGGSLRLAIPDRRYTFDFLRQETSLVDVLDAHVCRRRVPSPARILDFALHMAPVDCHAAWNGNIDPAQLVRGYSQQQALSLARDAHDKGTYHDVHCWVFTPLSFAELMGDLSRRELIGFECARLISTRRDTFEFFAHLTPNENPAARCASWERWAEALRQP